jgi:hypothetical protein
LARSTVDATCHSHSKSQLYSNRSPLPYAINIFAIINNGYYGERDI